MPSLEPAQQWCLNIELLPTATSYMQEKCLHRTGGVQGDLCYAWWSWNSPGVKVGVATREFRRVWSPSPRSMSMLSSSGELTRSCRTCRSCRIFFISFSNSVSFSTCLCGDKVGRNGRLADNQTMQNIEL